MNINLKNIILDNEEERYYEIYKIVCIPTKKCYIGQAVSHILNHKRYRPYGMEGRFKQHIHEAFSKKNNQTNEKMTFFFFSKKNHQTNEKMTIFFY